LSHTSLAPGMALAAALIAGALALTADAAHAASTVSVRNAFGGDDVVNASGLEAGVLGLVINADGSSSRVDADNVKAVVVLIGANDYGFAEPVPRKTPG
jgi:hypothetical protein